MIGAEVSDDVLIIGVGNRLRQDDGAGLVVADRLRARVGGTRIRESDGDPVDLLGLWSSDSAVWLVDAVVSGRAPGTVLRLDAISEPLPALDDPGSTHGLGPATAIELARGLGQLPRALVVFAIEAERVGHGAGLSPAVAAGVATAADAIAAEIAALLGAHRPRG